jgi:hypothetical protein
VRVVHHQYRVARGVQIGRSGHAHTGGPVEPGQLGEHGGLSVAARRDDAQP